MLQKKYVKSRDVSKVTFEIPLMHLPEAFEKVEKVSVVGEFNDWDADATPLEYVAKRKAYRTTVELDPNRHYQFRYLLNGETFFNEWEADGYESNGMGEDNSVLKTGNGHISA